MHMLTFVVSVRVAYKSKVGATDNRIVPVACRKSVQSTFDM